MNKLTNRVFLISGITMLSLAAAAADLSRPQPLSDAEWEKVRSHVGLLDNVSHLPSLLPLIMKHRDELNLSDDQRTVFRAWRTNNYRRMIEIMNDVIARRIGLSKAALDPSATSGDLISQQKEILQLQQELLLIKLSCRELIMKTFSTEQWNSFAFVLEEYPNLAGLLAH